MKAEEIRTTFIDFFKAREHTFVKSAPIFPKDDPSLLFTNAGMNQFKNIFLGISNEGNLKRAVNSQKCMRVSGKHNDLEEVGKDGAHHTFFEMLGNWSFGDYYKKETILFAWELLTKVYKLPKKRLYATVYKDDQEALDLWKKVTDIPHSSILKFDEKENFWEMGETGPCGPCSEIHIDLGEDLACGPKCGINCPCGRFMEVWNLVFIQYDRKANGQKNELKEKHVDTGMGFERIVSLIQNKRSNYQTDLFIPILQDLEKICKKPFKDNASGMPFRVIADHVRALTFSIADGVLPSNEGRGYVIRRLLRRAYRFGRKLDLHESFLHRLVPTVIDQMGAAFPELVERKDFIQKIVNTEEQGFEKTLDRGLEIFDDLVKGAGASGSKVLNGKAVFKLYDTYGFPADLTNQMAVELGLCIDQKGFDKEMEKQKARGRSASKFKDMAADDTKWQEVTSGPSSEFIGHQTLESDVTIRKLKKIDTNLLIITDKTPFYAESGGQAGDKGLFFNDNINIEIVDTRYEGPEIVHIGRCADCPDPADIKKLTARVDKGVRNDTRKNHTTTHILQYALRSVVGSHVKQSGSYVDSKRLRFDYTHYAALSQKEMDRAEQICNKLVTDNIPLEIEITSMDKAEKMGAIALFGEKYGEKVRVVKISDKSVELCGGTHVQSTGDIGYIHLLSESSIASGIRRIEAVAGRKAADLIRKNADIANSLALSFKVPFDKVPQQMTVLLDRIKAYEKKIKALKQKSAFSNIDELIKNCSNVSGVKVVKEKVDEADNKALQSKVDAVMDKLGSGVAALFGQSGSRVLIYVGVSDDLVSEKKLNAGKIVKELAGLVGGKGGGRPNRAQAGGKDVKNLDRAYKKAESIIKNFIK
jgi:alanyl-tRNA synthetase